MPDQIIPARNALFDALEADNMAEASVTVCRVMARFCHRLSQLDSTPEDVRADLIATANQWHDAAIDKLNAMKDAPQ